MENKKISLSGLSLEEIRNIIKKELDWEKYRADQIHSWIYSKYSSDILEWTNLSSDKRNILSEKFNIENLKILENLVSKIDHSEKYLFQTETGDLVESVLIKMRNLQTFTACISSQVGCAIGCPFCATGKLGFIRNLNPNEIVDQVICIERNIKKRLDNIVYMGQGEPFNNFENFLKSVEILRNSAGIGARNITVSTSGVVPKIIELGKRKSQINLAVSLHSVRQDLREKLVPIAKKWSLFELIKSLENYFENTHRRVTFEYVLLKDINDSDQDARGLSDFVRDLKFPCLINLIIYNNINNSNLIDNSFEKPATKRVHVFKEILERCGRKVTVRQSLGADISAGCGQLASNKN